MVRLFNHYFHAWTLRRVFVDFLLSLMALAGVVPAFVASIAAIVFGAALDRIEIGHRRSRCVRGALVELPRPRPQRHRRSPTRSSPTRC